MILENDSRSVRYSAPSAPARWRSREIRERKARIASWRGALYRAARQTPEQPIRRIVHIVVGHRPAVAVAGRNLDHANVAIYGLRPCADCEKKSEKQK